MSGSNLQDAVVTLSDCPGTTPPGCRVVVEPGAGAVHVSLHGRLDVHTVAEVRRALHEVMETYPVDMLLHLVDAEVYDATGLGVIVGVHHRARRLDRHVVVIDHSPRLDRLLRATRLHRVLVPRRSKAGLVTAAG